MPGGGGDTGTPTEGDTGPAHPRSQRLLWGFELFPTPPPLSRLEQGAGR